MTDAEDALVTELSAGAGERVYDRHCRRLVPVARVGVHDLPPASRQVPWPAGIFDLRRLQGLRSGMLIAPAVWESAYLAGDGELPWARIERDAFSLKVLGPMESQWHYETRVPCRLPSGEVMYYIGAPAEFVRILLPTPAAQE